MSDTDADVERLVRRACLGDPGAVTEIVRRYEPDLQQALHGKLGPRLRRRLDTPDLLQSTITLVLRDLPALEYRGEVAFRNWLLTVATRRLAQFARFHEAALRDVRREQSPRGAPPADADRTSPSEHAIRREEHARLRAAVAALPRAARQVVELRGFAGLAFAEIAERLGLPTPDAARQRYLRALANVRSALQRGEEEACPPKP